MNIEIEILNEKLIITLFLCNLQIHFDKSKKKCKLKYKTSNFVCVANIKTISHTTLKILF